MPGLIVYVDGNLYHGLHQAHGRRFLWLDLVKLARQLRPREEEVMVRYFTAPVLDDPQAASRQGSYLQALTAHNGPAVEVIHGRYQRKPKQCTKCQASWVSYEEKQTDVNIAISLVSDAATRKASSMLVVSADSDLAPAVKQARVLAPATHIAAAFPPRRSSGELRTLMPASFQIGRAKISASLLPDTIVDPETGHSISRPTKWR